MKFLKKDAVLAVLAIAVVWASLAGLACSSARATKDAAPDLPAGVLKFPGEVVGVVDGDTLEAEFTFRTRVRLPGCWAQELKAQHIDEKKSALEAKMHLSALALGKRAMFEVRLDGRRRLGDLFTFDRLVADATLAGDDATLSQRQVQAGHASSTKGGPLGR